MSRSIILTSVEPNVTGKALTIGEGTDTDTGEIVTFAGAVAMMGNLSTLLAQFDEHGKGDQPVVNIEDELIIDTIEAP